MSGRDRIIAALWLLAGFAALAAMMLCSKSSTAAPPGGYVRIGDDPALLWSDSARPRVIRALPDSIEAIIESGGEGLRIVDLPNAGWIYVPAACEDSIGLMIPIEHPFGLWPSPDGWIRHWWIDGRYLVGVRLDLSADAPPETTVVRLWYPAPSPSYCE